MTVLPAVALPCLSTRHRLSLVTVYPRYSRLTLLFTQVFVLKVTLEELFYTVVSNIPPASLLFALYLHVCVCVCLCKLPSRVQMEKGLQSPSSCPQHKRDSLVCVNNREIFVNNLIYMSILSGIETCLVVLQIRNLRLREFNSFQGLQGRHRKKSEPNEGILWWIQSKRHISGKAELNDGKV